MKSLFLLPVLLMLLNSRLCAQAAPTAAVSPTSGVRTEEYCEVVVIGRLMQPSLTAFVDFGQRQEGVFPDAYKDADGKPFRFNSPMAALNYLNAQGWELLQVYVTGTDTNTVHYVMRRRLAN